MVYRRSGQPPLVVSDASLEAYKLGAGLGHENAIAERETVQPAFDGSSIGPDLGGKKFDKFKARLREPLEALFHQAHAAHRGRRNGDPALRLYRHRRARSAAAFRASCKGGSIWL